tara:strand:+ start:743 stop:1051 length:309 start_codon:yes stop_codon:yes gene_type:complete
MWWFFFILFILISILSSITVYYALRRINQYENLILQFQNIIAIATQKMKTIDDSGHFESDDEVGFFFEQLKDIQILLNNVFEENIDNENNEENKDGQKKEEK